MNLDDMNNINDQFLIEEYKTLREEMKETKDRIFKIVIFSISVIPLSMYLLWKYDINIVTSVLPFLVIVVSMLYYNECISLLRCGRYIKDNIEPNLAKQDNTFKGWEDWLACERDDFGLRKIKKEKDIFFSYALHSLFLFYYANSSVLAYSFFKDKIGSSAGIFSAGVYSMLGVFYLLYIAINVNKKISAE